MLVAHWVTLNGMMITVLATTGKHWRLQHDFSIEPTASNILGTILSEILFFCLFHCFSFAFFLVLLLFGIMHLIYIIFRALIAGKVTSAMYDLNWILYFVVVGFPIETDYYNITIIAYS